jgi:DNA mismatch repair ATPase MutS
MILNHRLWEFAELEAFWKYFLPLSIYGKKQKDLKLFFTSPHALLGEYDRLERALQFLETHSDRIAGIEDALSRLPEIPSCVPNCCWGDDVFLFKKFLVNYERIVKSLPSFVQSEFAVEFHSTELLDFLRLSDAGVGDESFYLTEKFSEELASVRKRIRALDEKSKSIRAEHFDFLQSQFAIDFRCRDFVVLAAERARSLPPEHFVREPFDSHNFVVRPVFPAQLLDFAAEREGLVAAEHVAENRVYEIITQKIALELPALQSYVEAVTRLDMALAKARLAKEFGMSRPQISQSEIISVTEGRYLPLAIRCLAEDLRYWPLSICLKKKGNVVFGSNMGGKTVVLRSLAFFQVLAQMGFYVPADSFSTSVFESISYVGSVSVADSENTHEGLSGFGQEICDFSKVLESEARPVLVLMDEFARTTNSAEASALLSAVLEEFSERKGMFGVVSTHFMDLKVSASTCGFYRMKGLNRLAYAESFHETERKNETLVERIHRVSRFMQYEVVSETHLAPVRDAIAIAEVLGLSSDVIQKAKRYVGEKNER